MRSLDSHAWTREEEELVKRLWIDGLSASQIAVKIGDGVTKSAIIGKVHRMKIKRGDEVAVKAVQKMQAAVNRPASRRTASHHTAVPKPLPSRPPSSVRLVVDNAGPGVPFLKIKERGQCRWPLWDEETTRPEAMFYCGHATAEGQTYCERHRRRAVVRR